QRKNSLTLSIISRFHDRNLKTDFAHIFTTLVLLSRIRLAFSTNLSFPRLSLTTWLPFPHNFNLFILILHFHILLLTTLSHLFLPALPPIFITRIVTTTTTTTIIILQILLFIVLNDHLPDTKRRTPPQTLESRHALLDPLDLFLPQFQEFLLRIVVLHQMLTLTLIVRFHKPFVPALIQRPIHLDPPPYNFIAIGFLRSRSQRRRRRRRRRRTDD
ncbi:LOW QUALITY PROTEIN: hypothetical protein TorRG33x02_251990, partial [Trema orientale]